MDNLVNITGLEIRRSEMDNTAECVWLVPLEYRANGDPWTLFDSSARTLSGQNRMRTLMQYGRALERGIEISLATFSSEHYNTHVVAVDLITPVQHVV
jgi:hypothetical protein